MQSKVYSIQSCGSEAFEEWIALAKKSYDEYYSDIWEDDGSFYVKKSFNMEVLQQAQQQQDFIGFCLYQGEKAGVLLLRKHVSLPQDTEDLDWLLLDKVYLLGAFHGKGLGKYCLSWVEDYARQQGNQGIWLTSMAFSDSFPFYQKRGYQIVDSEWLDYPHMKKEYSQLHYMMKRL